MLLYLSGGLLTDLVDAAARTDPPASGEQLATPRMVLDTSVLISDPDCLTAFPGCDAVIPLVVVEELDQHKSRLDDVGRAARAVIRRIEELRIANGGDIRSPVELTTGGTLRIETNGLHINEIREHGLDPSKNDNRILAASLGQAAHARTVVVSNDAALRIKAAQLGLEAMEHQRLRGRSLIERPVGWSTIEVDCTHRRPGVQPPGRSGRSTTSTPMMPSCSAPRSRSATRCSGRAASRSSCATATAP